MGGITLAIVQTGLKLCVEDTITQRFYLCKLNLSVRLRFCQADFKA